MNGKKFRALKVNIMSQVLPHIMENKLLPLGLDKKYFPLFFVHYINLLIENQSLL